MNHEALPPFARSPRGALRWLLGRMNLGSGVEANQSPVDPLIEKSPTDSKKSIKTERRASEEKPTPQIYQLAEKLVGSKNPEDLKGTIKRIEEINQSLNPGIYAKGPYQDHFNGFKKWEFEDILNELRSVLLQKKVFKRVIITGLELF